MKAKVFYVVCIVLIAMGVTGCRKKSPPPTENSTQQTKAPKQPTTTQTVPEKTSTENLIPTKAEPERDQPEEIEYFALFLMGKKVGYAIQSRVVEEDEVTTSIDLALTLSRAGIPVSIQTKVITLETAAGKPLGFEVEQFFGLIPTKTVATIDEQGKVKVTMGSQQTEFDWPSGAVMSEGMRLLHMKNGLSEGTTYKAKLFDPSMMQVVDVEVNVGSKQNIDLLGRIVSLIQVQSTISTPQIGAITSTEYYDDELRLQKSITPVMGMTIEQVACTREFALGENDVLEVIDKMFMTSPEPLSNVNSAKSIIYHLSPTAGAVDLKMPSSDNQKVEQLSNGKIILTVEPVAAPAGVKFPYRGNDPTAIEALQPTRYVESDNKIIIDLARRAIGNTKDATVAARRIETFVADYVTDKSLSVGYATASEVAASKQGDCTEHAVLAAALCRAVGIPAQVVTGLAYVPEWRTVQNGFGGHAWVQAYLDGRWVGLDASFKSAGLGGYDAGHITLAVGNGNPEDFINLVNTMGQFKIDKVTVNNR